MLAMLCAWILWTWPAQPIAPTMSVVLDPRMTAAYESKERCTRELERVLKGGSYRVECWPVGVTPK